MSNLPRITPPTASCEKVTTVVVRGYQSTARDGLRSTWSMPSGRKTAPVRREGANNRTGGILLS